MNINFYYDYGNVLISVDCDIWKVEMAEHCAIWSIYFKIINIKWYFLVHCLLTIFSMDFFIMNLFCL